MTLRAGDSGSRRDGLASFFALVFGYTWGIAALYVIGTLRIIILCNSVLMTWVVNKARGSVLPAILLHWSTDRFLDWHYPAR